MTRSFLINNRTGIKAMSTHLDRTKAVARDLFYSPVIVDEIRNISPTIKHLTLHVENPKVTFKPGQWVDFHIPNLPVVGGYSMCSTPALLQQQSKLHLAVKYSDHAPAHWVHTKCTAGDHAAIQVGGDFYRVVTTENMNENILLIAAGVGINPMLSIFKHTAEVYETVEDKQKVGRTMLLYSATARDEMVFKSDIDTFCNNESLISKYFVTREELADKKIIANHRINENDLKTAVKKLSHPDKNLTCYLCGPLIMMETMKKSLIELGLKKEHVCYESWW